MLDVNVNQLYDGRVIVFTSKDRTTIGKLFVRIQEFYESEYESIRSNYFTLAEFKNIYTKSRGASTFNYFSDWLGFNVPGTVVLEFYNLFGLKHNDIHPNEKVILDELVHFINDNNPKFYVIGYWLGVDNVDPILNDIFVHEFCHALYIVDHNYRKSSLDLLLNIPVKLRSRLYRKIGQLGYSKGVMLDEAVAFLSTSDNEYLKDKFGEEYIKYQKPFIENFLIYAKHVEPKLKTLTVNDIETGTYSIRW